MILITHDNGIAAQARRGPDHGWKKLNQIRSMRNLSRRLKNEKREKIVIGVAAVAVVAGGIYAASGAGRGGSQIPQVAVTKAETRDGRRS